MNKAEYVAIVADALGESKGRATEIVDAVFESITQALRDGHDVKLPNFGNFVVVKTKARKARNPKTNQEVPVPAGHRVRFRPGKGLKDKVESSVSPKTSAPVEPVRISKVG